MTKGWILVNTRFNPNGDIDNERSKVFLNHSKGMMYLHETIIEDNEKGLMISIVPPYELKEIEIEI